MSPELRRRFNSFCSAVSTKRLSSRFSTLRLSSSTTSSDKRKFACFLEARIFSSNLYVEKYIETWLSCQYDIYFFYFQFRRLVPQKYIPVCMKEIFRAPAKNPSSPPFARGGLWGFPGNSSIRQHSLFGSGLAGLGSIPMFVGYL